MNKVSTETSILFVLGGLLLVSGILLGVANLFVPFMPYGAGNGWLGVVMYHSIHLACLSPFFLVCSVAHHIGYCSSAKSTSWGNDKNAKLMFLLSVAMVIACTIVYLPLSSAQGTGDYAWLNTFWWIFAVLSVTSLISAFFLSGLATGAPKKEWARLNLDVDSGGIPIQVEEKDLNHRQYLN